MPASVLRFAFLRPVRLKANQHLQPGLPGRRHAASVLGRLQRHLGPLARQFGQRLRDRQFDRLSADSCKGV